MSFEISWILLEFDCIIKEFTQPSLFLLVVDIVISHRRGHIVPDCLIIHACHSFLQSWLVSFGLLFLRFFGFQQLCSFVPQFLQPQFVLWRVADFFSELSLAPRSLALISLASRSLDIYGATSFAHRCATAASDWVGADRGRSRSRI